MKRIAAIAIVAVLVVTFVAGFYTSASSVTPSAPQTFSQKQMVVTTGILAGNLDGTQLYWWETSIRSTSNSPITSITASLDISETGWPVVVSTFFVGITPVTSIVPLGYNVTANAESTELTPPPGGFQPGQSFPEIVSVILRNGTTIQLHVTAQVFTLPG